MTNTNTIEMGCGLIRIGRVWGVVEQNVPTEKEVVSFLEAAVVLGITFFDTAPAYGYSEERLGIFLKSLSKTEREKLTVATKCGEHWDFETESSYVDHSLPALKQSIDQSLERLGLIDVLQLHKATVETVNSSDVLSAISYAREKGVSQFGASVSDVETGLKACEMDIYSYLQLPYNSEKDYLLPVIQAAKKAGKKVLFNRPFAMGALAQSNEPNQKQQELTEAFKFILETGVSGYILSGTANIEHLTENMHIFEEL